MHLSCIVLAVAGMLPALSSAAACNGFDALCNRQYSNVSFAGSHDSAFVGVLPVDDQFIGVTNQLNMGVRFLQAQTHNKNGVIEMCHTSCYLLDAGTLQQYLQTVANWVTAPGNEREVLTLLLTNQDGIAVANYGAVFEAVGLDQFVYTPSGVLTMDEWPTLGEMLDSGKRVVVFMDYHADTSSVPYILDEFTYFFETPYDTTDPNFPQCQIDRPSGASANGRMYLVNHYLDLSIFGILIPDEAAASTTNSLASIMKQADLCVDSYNREPNVMLLDWIDKGDAMAAEKELNNL